MCFCSRDHLVIKWTLFVIGSNCNFIVSFIVLHRRHRRSLTCDRTPPGLFRLSAYLRKVAVAAEIKRPRNRKQSKMRSQFLRLWKLMNMTKVCSTLLNCDHQFKWLPSWPLGTLWTFVSTMGRYSGKKCRLVSMFFLTSSFFLVEIVVGHVTNSMALVADSFHMLSDIAALIIAFISVRMSPKSWHKNTYGWARAEVLGETGSSRWHSIFPESKRPIKINYTCLLFL